MNSLGPINTLLLSTDMYVMPYQNSWTMAFFAMGMFRFKDFIKLNLLRCVLLLVAMGLLFIPWWGLLGAL